MITLPLEFSPQMAFFYFSNTISTDAKTKKLALSILSGVAALFSGGCIAGAFTGIMSLSSGFVSIPLICLSWGLFSMASQVKNYDDQEALRYMKWEAKKMNFLELIQAHQSLEIILS